MAYGLHWDGSIELDLKIFGQEISIQSKMLNGTDLHIKLLLHGYQMKLQNKPE